MGRISSHYNWHNSGKLVFWDKSTFETTQAHFGFYFYDDFAGADIAIPAAASPESGCKWVKKITGAAPPTVVGLADAAGGVMSLNLTADSQKQEAGLYMNDQRNFDVSKGLIFETKLAAVLPTDVAEAQWGLAGDYAEGGDNITYSLWFDIDGSGAVNCAKDDNATDQLVSSGLTILADVFHIYRIDCTDVTDIKFFIDGVEYCATTAFPYTATGANAILQPYFYIYKASGEGVGALYVDYVKIWQNR